ncbi:hypothetical protein ACKI1I_25260 [Streptomyces turgidiscabies]|uniref:hypothetical protein n=1 Tax=Streptomyces turgidiscabies TaxID=85558 RepID=UPI00076E5A88|nr:hypothetical protein [Streptomyces turgidiscabies]MDX3498628.1 hypothetical protein [Streptomyces turgidiscabies]GAQ73576.1 hypothetical protein T45_05336 [Streptomyces turgidiscabies]
MAVRIVRWGALLGLGGIWWWAVLRLALAPGAGVLEGAVAAGGWGLSLLPVHCVPKASAARVTAVSGVTGEVRGLGGAGIDAGAGATRASPHRRSDG